MTEHLINGTPLKRKIKEQSKLDKRKAIKFMNGVKTLSDSCLSYTLMKELPRFSKEETKILCKEMRSARTHLLEFMRKLGATS
jgi:hypothetical protein